MCGYLNPDRAGVNNSVDGNNVTTKLTILQPGEVVTETYIILGVFDDFASAQNYASYIRTRFVRFLVYQTLSSMHITQVSFQFVPTQNWGKIWTDEELYQKYSISQTEVEYIESLIKPMEETLFDPESVVDPNFGSFVLTDYGVKEGDQIVYTPTGTIATVLEGNLLDCDGTVYSVAQFTAKYMPRNKRSISGVCQGPKYFSYKGTTLYQLKESFLGGKKLGV